MPRGYASSSIIWYRSKDSDVVQLVR